MARLGRTASLLGMPASAVSLSTSATLWPASHCESRETVASALAHARIAGRYDPSSFRSSGDPLPRRDFFQADLKLAPAANVCPVRV